MKVTEGGAQGSGPTSPQYESWCQTFDSIRLFTDTRLSELTGDILTLVEIALPPGQQLDSLKSKVKAEVNRARTDFSQCHWDNLHALLEELGILEPPIGPTEPVEAA